MQPPIQRFLSLDVFRGMTICFMIIANTGGTSAVHFAPLLHAGWHGFTPTDLVFPSFLFCSSPSVRQRKVLQADVSPPSLVPCVDSAYIYKTAKSMA